MAATYKAEVIADLLDLTPRRVRQLVKEGVLPAGDKGLYEVKPMVVAYIRYLRRDSVADEKAPGSVGEAELRLKQARARQAELETEELEGKLIRVEAAEKAFVDMVSVARARLLALPSKLAPQLENETSAIKCQHLVETAIHDALATLAQTEVEDTSAARADRSAGANGGADAPRVSGVDAAA